MAEGELRWNVYNLVYAAESLRSIHAGFASVEGHMDEHPTRTGVQAERDDGNIGPGKLPRATTLPIRSSPKTVMMCSDRAQDRFF